MRPFHRLLPLLALTFGSLFAPAQAKKDVKAHVKPAPFAVLKESDTSLIDAVNAQFKAYYDAFAVGRHEIDWYSDPATVATKPERQGFLTALQVDAARTGLAVTPHVLIDQGVYEKGHWIGHNEGYVSSFVLPDGHSFIAFREDVYGSDNCLLTDEEAEAVADHELEHIRASVQRGHMLSPPKEDESGPVTEARISAYIEENRAEETAGDKHVVDLGHGVAFLRALIKIEGLDRYYYGLNQTSAKLRDRTSYDALREEMAPVDDHPPDQTRYAVVWAALPRTDKKAHPELRPNSQ